MHALSNGVYIKNRDDGVHHSFAHIILYSPYLYYSVPIALPFSSLLYKLEGFFSLFGNMGHAWPNRLVGNRDMLGIRRDDVTTIPCFIYTFLFFPRGGGGSLVSKADEGNEMKCIFGSNESFWLRLQQAKF
jgi:hypothetical protein